MLQKVFCFYLTMRIMSVLFLFCFFADPIGKTVKEEYVLVQDGLPIAKAFRMMDMTSVHGYDINSDRNGVFMVTTMLTDLNIKPTIGNNFDEFLSSNQFVAWELQDTMKIVDLPESRQNSIRDTATMNYMREAKRRRVRHESEPSFIRKTYSIGDTCRYKNSQSRQN